MACLAGGLASLCVAGACWAGALPPSLGSNLLRDYIHPAMTGFRDSAGRLHAAIGRYCANPAPQAGTDVVEEFEGLVNAWSHIEFLRFGPLVAEHRYERIHFWPDPRGIVLKQVQGMLNGSQVIPNAEALADQSVALQGMPALEYVLYREKGLLSDHAAGKGRACEYAVSVAGNLAAIGRQLTKEWHPESDFGRQFIHPATDSALYRSPQEVASEAFKVLSTGLQFARTVKIEPILGTGAAGAAARLAPFWRSGLSAKSQQAAIEGLHRFYQAGAYEYAGNERWMDESLMGELQRAATLFSDFPAPWEQAVLSQEGQRQLGLAALILKNAKRVVDEDLAPAFGVRIGFNALDGD